jgi:peptidoglycan/xylan/chitin deacetylase (PgdA/CDA1 family)
MSAERAGAFVVSLDFELHWGLHDKWSTGGYRRNLLGVREAIPGMLALFREFDVHATWAAVGLLCFESKRELLDGLPGRRPSYVRSELSSYRLLDEIGENERDDPFHFGPSLVRRIAETPNQELGTHTFSHYYCLEAGQTLADFRADLEAAVSVMRRRVGRTPRSIVFPRNQISAAAVAVCGELGMVAYRGNPPGWAYQARADGEESPARRAFRLADAYAPLTGTSSQPRPSGVAPVDVTASRYLRPYARSLHRLESLRLRRITADLEYAATRGRMFHLWWHPHDFGGHVAENLHVLRQILVQFDALRARHGMTSLTMAEAAGRVGAAEQAAPAEAVA